MLLKDYLKKICNYEEEVYERQGKISKMEKSFEEAKEKIASKKKELEKKVKDHNERYEYYKNYKAQETESFSNDLVKAIVITILTMIATIVFHLVLRYFIIGFAGNTRGLRYVLVLLIANILPSIPITVFLVKDTLCSLSTTISVFVIADVILTFITGIYGAIYSLCNGTIGGAVLAAMFFFIIVEVIIGTLICIRIYKDFKNDVNAKKRSLAAIPKNIEITRNTLMQSKKELAEYEAKANKALFLMVTAIDTEKTALKQAENSLKQLYAQNIVHPKYQYWVAIATFYEYLDTKIRYELEGPQGAYDLYETELRAKKIYNSLNEIKSQGRAIYQSQSYIRNQLATISCQIESFKPSEYDI